MKQTTRALLIGKLMIENPLVVQFNINHLKQVNERGIPLSSRGQLTLSLNLSWEESQLLFAEFSNITKYDSGISTTVEGE